MKGRDIPYSAEELAWIEARKHLPRAELHRVFVATFGRDDVNRANLTALCKRKGWFTGRTGCFEPGHDRSPNKGVKGWCAPGSEKGWFRKGERRGVATKLYQPIGTEKVRDGYICRKVNDDLPPQRRWRAVHLIRWEAMHGPLPAGHALKCLDGDRLNTDLANWECVPRAMLPRLAGGRGKKLPYDSAPAEIKPTLMAAAKLQHAARERRRRDA